MKGEKYKGKLLLIQTDERGICTLALNRPEKHNAFNAELISELLQALEEIDGEPDIQILVLTGSGRSFSSGADLEWMRKSASYDEASNRNDAEQLATLMRTLYELGKPTIARVNGPAYGGGLGLIACCDIAIATTTAKFAFTEVRLGLIPAVISPYIVMAIGTRQARRLFLTAEQFSSAEAQTLGLVHQVVAESDLDASVSEHTAQLLKAGPTASRACKKLTQQFAEKHMDAEMAVLIAALRTSPEGREGVAAFLEKRTPEWVKGREKRKEER